MTGLLYDLSDATSQFAYEKHPMSRIKTFLPLYTILQSTVDHVIKHNFLIKYIRGGVNKLIVNYLTSIGQNFLFLAKTSTISAGGAT